jgi:hypothetical protein
LPFRVVGPCPASIQRCCRQAAYAVGSRSQCNEVRTPKRRPRDDANRPTTPKTIPPWHAAYAAFREVLPDMPEEQAKHETTHAIAYAAANHTKWFSAGVYGR